MRHTTPDALLSRALLCFVHVHAPTFEELAAWFGTPGGQEAHVLRKHGVIVLDGGRVRLSRRHLSPDGTVFVWGRRMFLLDRDEVRLVRYGPEGPPVFAEDA